ncbi:DNA repair protein [Bifidobacterium xylocopae]|uniref:DNA repair protein n=2 Tax=Bifidobacterium xylocopae TaxID=2493119 RepID=A0A366KBQ8_9BIFI|nr:DNA repair protein [Bifidobacterium xylocopae]
MGARDLYEALVRAIGRVNWWPAESDFEMMVGAILVQHTAWGNVDTSLAVLRQAGLLEPVAMAEVGYDRLRALISPSGFMKAKARTCIGLAQWMLGRGLRRPDVGPSADRRLRESLLAVPGVGPETADVIRLYAFDQPCFIWDAYARRLLPAVGWPEWGSYETARIQGAAFMDPAGFGLDELKEYHGLIVEAGKCARQTGDWSFLAEGPSGFDGGTPGRPS